MHAETIVATRPMCATHSHIDFDGVVGVRHELAETFLRPYRIAFNTLTVHLAVTEPQVVSIIVVSVRRPGNASGEQAYGEHCGSDTA